jgi:hypothetical protein
MTLFLLIFRSIHTTRFRSEFFFFFVGKQGQTTLRDTTCPSPFPLHLVLRPFSVLCPFSMSARVAGGRKTQGHKPSSKALPVKRGSRARKPAEEDEEEEVTADLKAGAPRVLWTSDRTERLVEWLENNVEDHQRLFSDSAQDAKEEKRRRRTAKSVKTSFYIKIAEYVFSADKDVRIRDDLKEHGGKRYAKTVENRITR